MWKRGDSFMNKIRPVLLIIFVLATYMILSDTIVNLLANTGSFLRHDNKAELYESTFKTKIEELEKEILEYERQTEGLKIYEGESYILAKTAIRNIYDIYDYIIVNTASKVSIGDVALNEAGLVGIVSEATTSTAKISLLTGQNKMSVKIGENYGILSNYDRTKNEFLVSNIDNYKVIETGAQVTTSGFQEIAPGLPIGTVTAIETKGVEKVIRVRPHVDFKNINYLLIAAK